MGGTAPNTRLGKLAITLVVEQETFTS